MPAMRRTVLFVTALYTSAVACVGGRNLDAGSEEEPVVVVIVADDDGGSSVGGSGVGGMAEGGVGGEGAGGQGGRGGGIMPLECLTCIGIECPDAVGCVTDPTCIQGVVCAVGQCLGGGGTPDFMCLLDCFDGDIDAALSAVDALTCIGGSCSDTCGNLIPFP